MGRRRRPLGRRWRPLGWRRLQSGWRRIWRRRIPAVVVQNNFGGKMKVKAIFTTMAILLCCSFVMAQQVSVNYNHNASFAQYHTYAWGSNNSNEIKNSILAQVAQQDINSAMQGKGLQMVQESQNPDLILTANGGMQQQTSY